MTHASFEEGLYAERYVAGRLDAQDEVLFEEHLMTCPECQGAVEAAQGLRRGLQLEAARTTGLERPVASRFSRPALSWLPNLAWAAAVMLAIATAFFFYRESASHREQAQRADAAALAARQEAAERLAAQQGQWQAKLEDLERAVEAAKDRAPKTPDVSSVPSKPLAGLPVFLLATLRDAPSELTLEREELKAGFTLALDAAPDRQVEFYRVSLSDERGRQLFSRDGLVPSALDAILVTFPGDFLEPGLYELHLAGSRKDGGRSDVARFTLRVR